MAALLRQGARRIAGSVLQRTQAAVTSPAVAEERRGLVSRRMYSTEEKGSEEITLKIQQKKEKLYDLMAEQSFWTSSFSNKRLLRHLSVEVNPRLEDSKWYLLSFSKRAINAVEIAGFIALTSLVASAVPPFKRFIEDRKLVRAMIAKEMREQSGETGPGLIENEN